MCEEEAKTWIVFNGEIYNYLEIKEELKVIEAKLIPVCEYIPLTCSPDGKLVPLFTAAMRSLNR